MAASAARAVMAVSGPNVSDLRLADLFWMYFSLDMLSAVVPASSDCYNLISLKGTT